jgi:geranylgeranyl diphosphate synthase type II
MRAGYVTALIIVTLLIVILCLWQRGTEPVKPTAQWLHVGEYQNRIESYVKENLNKETNGDMRGMCEYAVSGGKKIRSVILLSIASRNGEKPGASNAAVAVEYLHAASLILDDIMDKDKYRRGKKSLYKVYGIGPAQMCALFLIGLAGKLMREVACECDIGDGDRNAMRVFIYDNIFDNLQKLIDGQYQDISGSNENIESIIHKKTGTLFEIPFVLGWTIDNGRVPTDTELDTLRKMSANFGQMFQIADDLEDMEKDAKSKSKFNYALNNGTDKAKDYYNECATIFSDLASKLGIMTAELDELFINVLKN